MSLLDTASLIVTPNAYAESKLYSVIPSDGSGDLSVTRATTATRVNSAGLVELVPYNLFTYSEQFDNADWSKSSGTITANSTTAPNGTTTADTFTGNGALSNHDFFEGFTGGANTTASIYVKKNTAQFVYISLNYQSSGVNWATGVYDLDNLTTATFQSGGVTNQVATITDEGNGWRRITLSVATANTTLFCMYGLSNSMSPTLGSRGRVENSSSQSFYAWGAQVVEGSTAKDYQKTETRLNIPRLDYSNGTCPSLLVEPQRTNLFTYSSSFDNAAWTKNSVTITANATTSPSGVQDADKMILGNGSQVEPVAFQLLDITANTRTLTFFAKASEYNIAFARVGGSVTVPIVLFELSGNGSILHNQNALSYSIEPLEDGWYRCSMTYAHGIAFAPNVGVCSPTYSVSATSVTSTGNGTSGIFIWGAQVEVGSYATSYIPTTSASVTRNADVISKTGISSLIGQTEGTFFVDIYRENLASPFIFMLANSVGSSAYLNSIYMFQQANGTIVSDGFISGTLQFSFSSSGLSVGRHKLAIAYKQNDFVWYIDGVQVATDTSGNVPTFSAFEINGADISSTSNVETNAAALWKTRLTNTQLAQLTSI
jgi:hypothetical protein